MPMTARRRRRGRRDRRRPVARRSSTWSPSAASAAPRPPRAGRRARRGHAPRCAGTRAASSATRRSGVSRRPAVGGRGRRARRRRRRVDACDRAGQRPAGGHDRDRACGQLRALGEALRQVGVRRRVRFSRPAARRPGRRCARRAARGRRAAGGRSRRGGSARSPRRSRAGGLVAPERDGGARAGLDWPMASLRVAWPSSTSSSATSTATSSRIIDAVKAGPRPPAATSSPSPSWRSPATRRRTWCCRPASSPTTWRRSTEVAAAHRPCAAVVGFVDRRPATSYNAAAVCADGAVRRHLPQAARCPTTRCSTSSATSRPGPSRSSCS